MSAFGGLGIGLSALTAQKVAIDTVGQNIANASTDGYHRQDVSLSALGAAVVPSMYAGSVVSTGQGVVVNGVTRSADSFLQTQSNNANAGNALLTGKQQTLSQVQDAFGEPSDDALQTTLAGFWSQWGQAGNTSGDSTAVRTNLLQTATTLTGQFNQVAGQIGSLWTNSRQQLAATAQSINTTASQVATLNTQIQAAVNGGSDANALQDKRDTLLKTLAQQAGATFTPQDDGTVTVDLNGQTLVRAGVASTLTTTGPTQPGDPLTPSSVALAFHNPDGSTTPVVGAGGTAGAYLDAVNTTLPAYANQLDAVASAVVTAVNTQQAAGYDQNGNVGGHILSGTTAASMSVATTDPSKLALSAVAPTNGVPSTDQSNAQAMAKIPLGSSSPDAKYAALVVGLGVEAQSVNNQAKTQQAVTTAADAALDSSTGVDIDEESTKLIQYQTAYEAAAKYISTVNDTLQTLMAMVTS